MHEYDITKELVKQISDILKDKNIKSQLKIYLELGQLSTFSMEPIEFYFEQLSKDNQILNKLNTKLIITSISGEIICNNCNTKNKIDNYLEKYCEKCCSLCCRVAVLQETFLKLTMCGL